ncbi:MAG: exonuclease V subunit gamma [Balneolaceae bacterium]|nr:MAG: exonuclease V subunit gamma [Balneolaceae bacterium]
MIHIISSLSLTELSRKLADDILSVCPVNPLTPHTIIVPNQDTARWLKLFIAEKNGIAANLQFLLPAEWQWKQVRKLYPDLPESLRSDIEPMKWAVFGLLMNPEERSSFPVLERYIRAQGREREETAALQLSSQIASVFDQYLIYRPEMMLRWQNGATGKDDDEVWQSAFWRKLCNRWKSAETRKETLNKAELFANTLDALVSGEISVDENLFCFNIGLIPKPVLSLLKETGKYCHLELFLMQPSQNLKDPENELLVSFGEDLAQIQRLYQTLGRPEELLADEQFPDTLLGRIRQSIINNIPLNNVKSGTDQESVQIRSCHSPLREVETLHQFLLELFERDDALQPEDILVVSPDIEEYGPFIRAVFDNPEVGQPAIPYHLASFRHHNELERALNQLLSVADSRFHFTPVMDFFSMEPVRETFGVSDTAAGMVKRWMQENQVIWGLNSAHRTELGQPADDLQTWHTALRRGWLGQWMGETDNYEEFPQLLYQGVQSVSQQEIWAAFSFFLFQLDEIRRQININRSIPEWCEWLQSKLPNFFLEKLKTGTDGMKIMLKIDSLSDYTTLAGCDVKVPFSLFRTEIIKLLESSNAAGARFTGGITFSSMVPVRSIPFRIIALIGLNDQSFPRKQSTPDFDLMARQPRDGERNRKQEDRNLFLESILAAGDVHYCSYIGQSPVDNETIPPSSIVSEWVELVTIASGIDEPQIVKKEALTGFSPSAFRNRGSFSKNYFLTAQAMHNEEQIVSGLEQAGPLPEPEDQEEILVSDLTRFFKNPPAMFLQKRFGVYFEEPDEEKEEFEAGHLETHILFQKVFGWVASGQADGRIRSLLFESGILPSGWLGEKMVNNLLEHTHTAIQLLREHDFEPNLHHEEISILLNSSVINDSISTYSMEGLLDINPSGASGQNLIQSWIRHLCWLNNGGSGPSWLLCNLKKGEPKLVRFNDPGNTDELLNVLLQLYKEGQVKPLKFFTNSLVEYSENDDSSREYKARLAFEGGYNRYGERENIFVQSLLGPDVSFSEEFLDERFLAVIDAMLTSKEEVV